MVERPNVDQTVYDGFHNGNGAYRVLGVCVADWYSELVCAQDAHELFEHLFTRANCGNVLRALTYVALIVSGPSWVRAGTGRKRRWSE